MRDGDEIESDSSIIYRSQSQKQRESSVTEIPTQSISEIPNTAGNRVKGTKKRKRADITEDDDAMSSDQPASGD